MSLHFKGKLNQLYKLWPAGTVAVLPWLKSLGIKRQLVQKYEKSDWVQSIGRGAIIKSGQSVSWQGGLYAVQKLLHQKIHIGGKTALEILGASHYVPLGQATVRLYGEPKEKLPKWFTDYAWPNPIEYYSTNLFSTHPELGLTSRSFGTFELNLSSRERSIFEVLYLVPKEQDIIEAFQLLENLTTLRPKLVQQLLEACSSIKVKRLFLLLAERADYSWFKKLDLKKVDLGSGKRVVYENGKLDKNYNITVSKEFYEYE